MFAIRHLLLPVFLLLLSGCAELQYYGHAISGQLDVLSKSRPINEVHEDPSTEAEVSEKLKAVQRMHEFAIRDLSLPDSDSFRSYSDVERDYVLWNVFATPELALTTKQWCYPFLGCLGYRSYFEKAYAESVAKELKEEGWDVHIAPSPAYSTRGFFADPIYSPMLRYDDLTLAGILFHELAHERVYFKNDSELNESFAVAVQNEGIKRWLVHEKKPQYYADYIIDQQRDKQFVTLLLKYRSKLEKVYKSELADNKKRIEKRQLLISLRKEYRMLRKEWAGYTGYDHWFNKPLNNARLAPVGTYHGHVDSFAALLKSRHGNLADFYSYVEELADLPIDKRHQKLLETGDREH